MAKKKKQEKPPEPTKRRLHIELITQFLNLSTAGFGLVAALAWNETIQAFVKEYVAPYTPGSGVVSKLIYALIVTILAVFITYQLSKISARFPQNKS